MGPSVSSSPRGAQALRLPLVRGRFVRFVMGKPYAGEDLDKLSKEKKKVEEVLAKTSPTAPEKFSKAFQAYLDSLVEYTKKADEERAAKKT